VLFEKFVEQHGVHLVVAHAAESDRRFEFHKRSQLFVRVHNVTLSVPAMRVSNADCSSLTINGSDITQAATAFLEIVGDDLPIFHRPVYLTDY